MPQQSSKDLVTVGILGAGQVAQQHARAFSQLGSGVKIVGIADLDERRARDLAAGCQAEAFTDYRALLDLAPTIAVVCLPHHLHREAAEAAAAVGSHILMEKPLATTLEDARAIVESCERHGVRLTISFVHRYRIELQHARQIIAAGRIGTPAIAVDSFCSQGGSHVPGWVWDKRQAGGGVLMYGGIHSIDRLRWLVGSEVTEVYARIATYSQQTDVEDGLVATLVFENGCLGSLIENSPGYLVTPKSWDTEVYGSEGRVRIRTREYVEYTSESQAYRLDVTRDDNFLAQARDFVAAVREERAPWITAADGLRSLEIAMAIYRSAEQGRPVSVSDVRG